MAIFEHFQQKRVWKEGKFHFKCLCAHLEIVSNPLHEQCLQMHKKTQLTETRKRKLENST